MKLLPLTQGMFAKVDACHWVVVSRFRWYYQRCYGRRSHEQGYAVRDVYESGRRRRVMLHNFIWVLEHGPIPQDRTVDHISRDKLDCRLSTNLRLANRRQQIKNQWLRRNSMSGYTGVTWDSSCNKWMAYISVNGSQRTLGRYDCKHAAARAYNAAARRYHGRFAVLNVIPKAA